MKQSNARLFATTLALAAWAAPAAAGGRGTTPPPVVESVEIDPAGSRLNLSGRHFGSSAPLLMLGTHRLEVSESTPTQVSAKLPAQLRPALYRLTINNLQPPSEATSLYLQFPTPAEPAAGPDR